MPETYIETERLILRDWREDDWPAFLRHTNTSAVMRWLGGVMDDEAAEAMRARLGAYASEHGHTFWAVERKADGGDLAGELLGFCGLKRCNQEGGPVGECEVGWRFRADSWGRGYAREAAEASLHAGFEDYDAPLIVALTVGANTASWGLMRRLGMRRREDLDFFSTGVIMENENVIVYSITREEWDAGQ